MFGYNRVQGLSWDLNVPAGIVVDGAIHAAANSFFVDQDGNPTLNCMSYYISTGALTQYSDSVIWRRKDTTAVMTQLDDGSVRLWQGLDSRAKITCTAGIGLFGHTAPSSAPTITGSRAAMGVGTYQVIQALAATGAIVDGTTA